MPAAIPFYTVDDLEHFPADGNRYELLDGVLLVTPQAELQHQQVSLRIAHLIMSALGESAGVTAPGVVIFGERTEFQPDVLVTPPQPLSARWTDVTEHWLAVEVYSPSSRIYDREFKTPEYLRRGVGTVWLVDAEARTIEVFFASGGQYLERERITWTRPGSTVKVEINLAHLFR